MASSIIVNEVTYNAVPAIQSPKQGGGMAKFTDTSDATISGGAQMLDGVTAYDADGIKVTGSIQSKAAATYTPTTSDQTIQAGQYLGGAQTIKGDANLTPANIAKNVQIFGVTGALSAATIVQDSQTKILTIT